MANDAQKVAETRLWAKRLGVSGIIVGSVAFVFIKTNPMTSLVLLLATWLLVTLAIAHCARLLLDGDRNVMLVVIVVGLCTLWGIAGGAAFGLSMSFLR